MQEKMNNYWDKLRSTNKWIIIFKVVKIIGWLISLLGLIWPLIPFTSAAKHSFQTLVFSLTGFVITGFGDVINDLWFKPRKEELSVESIISLQETKTKKE